MAVLNFKGSVGIEFEMEVVVTFGVVVVGAVHIHVGGAVGVDVDVLNASFKDAVVVADASAVHHGAQLALNVPVGTGICGVPSSHGIILLNKIQEQELSISIITYFCVFVKY